MPKFVNTNDHPVRARNGTVLVRIRPGQVVEADGDYADSLESVPGVENATQAQAKRHEDAVAAAAAVGQGGEPGRRLAEKLALGPARTALRLAVAAPLRRVIGDDAAPLGPASGEVSTKAQEAVKDEAHRRAFAPGERLPGDRVAGVGTPPDMIPASSDPSSGEIENAQARNAERAEQVLEELGEAGRDVLASKPYESTPADDAPADEPDESDESGE